VDLGPSRPRCRPGLPPGRIGGSRVLPLGTDDARARLGRPHRPRTVWWRRLARLLGRGLRRGLAAARRAPDLERAATGPAHPPAAP